MEGSVQGLQFLAFLNGVEIVSLLAVILVLFGARSLDGAGRRFTFVARARFDEEAEEAGRSVGGIAGAPGFQAMTPENEVAEIYDPAAVSDPHRAALARLRRRLTALRVFLARLMGRVNQWRVG